VRFFLASLEQEQFTSGRGVASQFITRRHF